MGTSENLKMSDKYIKQMVANCIEGLPNEACGILAAKNNNVVNIYAVTNADKSPVTYRLESREHFKAMEEIEEKDWKLAGFYHSHVKSPARPSETDLRLANYPDAYYFIVSLMEKGNPEVKAYRMNNSGFKEYEYEVIENE